MCILLRTVVIHGTAQDAFCFKAKRQFIVPSQKMFENRYFPVFMLAYTQDTKGNGVPQSNDTLTAASKF